MDAHGSVRCLVVVFLLAGGGWAGAQTAIPATSPTQLNPARPVSAASSTQSAGSESESRATVEFSGGKLEIQAHDSSLNQILRDICRQTGMVVTGGVVDEPVFGNYGPGSPGEVLSELLDGTGSNMILEAGRDGVPMKLILTPRQGGPTPPNPNAAVFEQRAQEEERERHEDRPPVENPPQESIGRRQGGFGSGGAGPAVQGPGSGPEAGGANSSAAGSGGSGGGNPQSPNGVLTPEQIYQQLQQLQKAQPHQ